MNLRVYLLFVTLAGVSFFVSAQNPKIEKEPAWVTVRNVDLYTSTMDDEAESGYVDQVYEKQVHLNEDAVYSRICNRILTEAGVQNNSEISIEYDPSYEKLTLHTVRIFRDGEMINKLEASKLKVIQEESDRSRFMYNGNKTALLLLDDVRKGDIIDYSYTMKGFNPVLKDRFTYFFTTQFSVPFYHLYYKLIVPKGRKIHIKNDRTEIANKTTEGEKETVYEWTLDNVAPVRVQKNIPSWHDPYPSVMVSEYNSWKEVSDWAVELYPFNIQLSSPLQEKINDIRSAYPSDEDRILEAIRFVQDEIRYFGNEQGLNSHKPHNPNQIFQQRHGDCKDKTYLLCIMLHHLGIEAQPVLINTTYKKTIYNWLPSVGAFDHVTVRLKYGENWHYIDPTIAHQRGRLKNISYPDYQTGLVVSPETVSLSSIPFSRNSMVNVKEIIEVKDMTGRAKLSVLTYYHGEAADDVRARFKENSKYEMQEEYLDYYSSYFEELTADSLHTSEGENGSYIVREYYTIKEFWETEKNKKKFIVSPFVISSLYQRASDLPRQMPFALNFPLKYTEDIEIRLPEEWKTQTESTEVKGNAFIFQSVYSSEDKKVTLHYEYETLKDHVDASEVGQYVTDYEKMNEASSYQLSLDTRLAQFNTSASAAGGSSGSWNSIFNIAYVILAVSFFATLLFRRNRRSY